MVSKKDVDKNDPDAPRAFVFRGDHLALDFINTEIRDAAGEIVDLLDCPAALADWLTQTGLLSSGQNGVTESQLRAARAFRRALRAVAEARVTRSGIPADAVSEVNAVLRSGVGYRRLVSEEGRLRQERVQVESSPLRILLPIAEAAGDLFTGEQAGFVRKCEGASCILFFLDVSKNHKRRWCSMSACGNRRKVAAHYQRTHRQAGET
jgi:predicted RNA-binding Zn ribbon-like protein